MAAEKTRKTKQVRTRAEPTAATRTRARVGAQQAAAGPGRWAQVLDFVGLLVALFLILALSSHDPQDPGFSRASSGGGIANWGGVVGAYLADLALQVLGWAAWAVALVPVVFVRRLARRAAGGWAGRGALAFAVVGVATGLALATPASPEAAFPAGGVLGLVIANALRQILGGPGAWLLVGGVVTGCVAVALGLDGQTLAEGVLQGAERFLRWLGGRVGAATLASLRLVWRGLRGLAGGIWAVAWFALRLPWWALRGALSLPGRAWRAFRARAPEVPPEEQHAPFEPAMVEENSLPPATGPVPTKDRRPTIGEPLPAPVHADKPRDRPTVLGTRELVEAEWEPTEQGVEPRPEREGTDFWDPAWRGSTAARDTRPSAHAGLDGVAGGSTPPAIVEVEAVEVPSVYDAPDPEALDELPPPAPRTSLPWDDPGDGEARPPSVIEPVHADAEPRDPRSVSLEPGCLESGGNEDDGKLLVPTLHEEPFELPDLGLLDRHERSVASFDEDELRRLAGSLEEKLASFGISGQVVAIRPGPVVTTFEYLPAAGVKISKIASLQDDIAMAMRAIAVRIVAPIPGKGVVGIEIPAADRQTVWIRDILASEAFRKGNQTLPLVLGKNVEGRPVVADLAKMPHLLIGGATGTGKSVGINAMLTSLLFTRTPEELRMIMVDPKVLEFQPYKDIPHLLHPVVTEAKLANAALKWAVEEMERRYRLLGRWGTRNVRGYNERVEEELKDWSPAKARRLAPPGWSPDEPPPRPEKLPYLLIVIDELADLVKSVGKEVEESIVRLAQKSRAAGLHLVVATQRPSVDVVTGLIKANFPCRIAFQVRARVDGRTILDQNGAETLLGNGDMLYIPPGVADAQRVHGAYVSDEEVRRVCAHLRSQGIPRYDAKIRVEDGPEGDLPADGEYDEYYDLAVQLVAEARRASTSMIQRHFKIGYNRAARIIEMMERDGVVGPADGARPREVLARPIVD